MKSYGRNKNVHHYFSFFPCFCDINLMQKRFSFLFVCLFLVSLAVKYTMAEKSRHRELEETAYITPSVRK